MTPQPEMSAQGNLIDVAIRLLEEGGLEAVKVRRIAGEIGMSTMAVYTHFGGMAELLNAVVQEGFLRLAVTVGGVGTSEEPMADFFGQGLVYRDWALRNPRLYTLMFGLSTDLGRSLRQDMTATGTISALPEGQAAFDVMTGAVRRMIAAKEIRSVDPVAAAGQFLAATHGYVLLEIAGFFGNDGNGLAWVFAPMSLSIAVGLGANHEAAEAAGLAAIQRTEIR